MRYYSQLKVFYANNFNFLAIILYWILSAFKMRSFLFHGRFWAEEGAIFYSQLASKSPFDGAFYIFHGHLELVTNLIVYASTFVELKYAPLLTTCFSLAIQSLPIYLVVFYRKILCLSRSKIILIIFVALGLPQADEVWANSINLHFHFAFVAAIILALSFSEAPMKWGFRIMLFVSGLSGIPSNFLVPLFGFQALKRRNKEHFIQFLILSCTSIFQVILLIFHSSETGNRTYLFDPLVFFLAPTAQSIISPIFGTNIGNQLIQILRFSLKLELQPILFSSIFFMPLIYLFSIGLSETYMPTRLLVFSSLTLLFFSILTALGPKIDLISENGGGRYFYIPNLIIFVALISHHKKFNLFLAAPLISLMINSISNINYHPSGPDWVSSIEQSEAQKTNNFAIWPSGWTMSVVKP